MYSAGALMLSLGLAAVLAASLPWAAPARPTKIVGGGPVEPGAYPAVVAITVPGGLCTGTLVSERVVLTAAHCVNGSLPPELLEVRLGDDVNLPGAPAYAVARYGAHPDYCGNDDPPCKEDVWDYGYVVLAEPVVGVAPIRPVTRQEEWDEAMAIGDPITLVGYGFDEKMLLGIKREVEVEIVARSSSGREFRAGGMGKDSCNGDSGGPVLVTLASGETLLAGVTSRGFLDCGKGGFYGAPYPALCWLSKETGVDLRADGCDSCDCLDMTDPKSRCGCAAGEASGGLLALVALLLAVRRRGSRVTPFAG